MSDDIQKHLRNAFEHAKAYRGQGRVADYIPALAKVDPSKFGMSLALPNGKFYCVGDATEPFSIQSVSKVFTLSLALERSGDDLWKSVGREPSGSSFNSIVQLETEGGIPRNPLINAGAIATTDRLMDGQSADDTAAEILAFMQERADDPSVFIDQEVASSEAATGSRNRSLAHFMEAFSNMRHPIETSLSVYFRQCAIAMSTRQLARAGLYLAFGGTDPISGKDIVSTEHCRHINAIMMGCGHYDNSGEFAYRVGLPGKSGVGGGILTIAPGRGAIAVWSPGLNDAGTSLVGSKALEHFVHALNWSIFT
ncbi:glutaminase [Hellea sp.]|nr:glutaminase [Hellea sp.]